MLLVKKLMRTLYTCVSRSLEKLIKVTDDIRESKDQINFVVLVLLGFSKIFDCINHKLLLHKFKTIFKLPESASDLVRSHLFAWSQAAIFLKLLLHSNLNATVLWPIFPLIFNDR